MESIYTELALYGSKNECARTDTVFLPISEVCDGKVSLKNLQLSFSNPKQKNFRFFLQKTKYSDQITNV